jgi:hypothetical protein
MKLRGSLGNNLKIYSNKLENLEDMDKWLDVYDLQKLVQEDINNLHRCIKSNEIEAP